MNEITPDIVLKAYAAGLFPMAENADDPHLFWVEPKQRGIIPLSTFHVPKRLQRTLRTHPFYIRFDQDFEGVITACAACTLGDKSRDKTWINSTIRHLYGELFKMGHCHTVEVYHDHHLVGGLYGLALGGAFFGESMFHTMRDASKIALVALVERLKQGGFSLLDTQFITDHLAQFGAIEVPRKAYKILLDEALKGQGWWP
jgi:leucyl/phenylalanyl-tRNA---protein transferase